MWVFTKYGFFSAVCARQGDGRRGRPVDDNRIMLRARVREQLLALQQRFPKLLSDFSIQEFVGTDYAYRIFVPKSLWSKVLGELAEEIDYDNFKSSVARHQSTDDDVYEHALHKVWEVMYELQK